LLAAIWMASPVCGFRPSRAGRAATLKMPSPETTDRIPGDEGIENGIYHGLHRLARRFTGTLINEALVRGYPDRLDHGSHQTPRWREVDSNLRSLSLDFREGEGGRSGRSQKSRLFHGDQRFESLSLRQASPPHA
jgi:hypothetical protein